MCGVSKQISRQRRIEARTSAQARTPGPVCCLCQCLIAFAYYIAGLALPDDTPVLSEEIGGILEPERMIQAHMHRGQQCGAQVQLGHPVIGWAAIGSKGGVAVTTDKDTYYAERLIISPGAWIDQLVPEFKGLCVPGRATVAWFKPPQPRLYHSSSFPVFILQDDHTDAAYYGFPEHGDAPGFKIGKFDAQYGCIPDTLDRNQHQSDIAPLAAVMQRYFPRAAGPVINFSACMFTATPDGQFIIDTHPRHPQVCCCAGWGPARRHGKPIEWH
eukprot:GHRR01031931.1.p1 GENE.GHRR01031931.1~~GHRR01031931.1.p1  ORF type:complete len:272 (+),score=46.65 GHRR01031931.1:67-882(+)